MRAVGPRDCGRVAVVRAVSDSWWIHHAGDLETPPESEWCGLSEITAERELDPDEVELVMACGVELPKCVVGWVAALNLERRLDAARMVEHHKAQFAHVWINAEVAIDDGSASGANVIYVSTYEPTGDEVVACAQVTRDSVCPIAWAALMDLVNEIADKEIARHK